MNLKEQFGESVKRYRLIKDMTQQELAEKAGISVDFLSLIERGKNAPSFGNLERIAKALSVEIRNLFELKKE